MLYLPAHVEPPLELKLRLHVLCFLHAATCEELFSQQTERALTAAEIKTSINARYTVGDKPNGAKRLKDCKELFNTNWSDLTVEDLAKLYHFLEEGKDLRDSFY